MTCCQLSLQLSLGQKLSVRNMNRIKVLTTHDEFSDFFLLLILLSMSWNDFLPPQWAHFNLNIAPKSSSFYSAELSPDQENIARPPKAHFKNMKRLCLTGTPNGFLSGLEIKRNLLSLFSEGEDDLFQRWKAEVSCHWWWNMEEHGGSNEQRMVRWNRCEFEGESI